MSTVRHAPLPSRGTRLALALGAAALLATAAFALTRLMGEGGGSDLGHEPVVEVPRFSLVLGEVSSVATAPHLSGDPASIRAEARAVRRVLHDLYLEAFLDPRSWTDGYRSLWPRFAEEAREDAMADGATLTLGAEAANRFRRVEPEVGSVDVTLLLDAAGHPASAVATVAFEATAVGVQGDRTALRSDGRFFLEPGPGGWTVVGYRVLRHDREGGPASGGAGGAGA